MMGGSSLVHVQRMRACGEQVGASMTGINTGGHSRGVSSSKHFP